MMVSTKGRYALRVMLDIAEHKNEGYLSLNDIATRQEVSMKYLEAIVASLCRAGLLESKRGKAGGYALTRSPANYTIGEIIKAAEGGLSPVACPECDGETCSRAPHCQTLPVWRNLDRIIDEYLEGITLADLLTGQVE